MNRESDQVQALNRALQHMVETASTTEDPVLAGGICILYKSTTMEMLSVEAPNMEFGTMNALTIALLSALIKEEPDSRVKHSLQQALDYARKAQQIRLSPPSGLIN